jgi:hypothetical protein
MYLVMTMRARGGRTGLMRGRRGMRATRTSKPSSINEHEERIEERFTTVKTPADEKA